MCSRCHPGLAAYPHGSPESAMLPQQPLAIFCAKTTLWPLFVQRQLLALWGYSLRFSAIGLSPESGDLAPARRESILEEQSCQGNSQSVTFTMGSNSSTSGNKNRISKRCIHSHIYCSALPNGQDKETTSVSIHRGMVKGHVMYLYSGILFSQEKEENSAICNDTDRTWGHYVQQGK